MNKPDQIHNDTITEQSSAPTKTLAEVEMEYIILTLNKHNGNKPVAAAKLGISLKTLYNKLNQYKQKP